MSEESSRAIKDPHVALRASLGRIAMKIGWEKLAQIGAALDPPVGWEADMLRKFASGVGGTRGMTERIPSLVHLTALLESSIDARRPGDRAELIQLFRTIFRGKTTQPEGRDISGHYFLYHGSYLREDHFVVRALKISALGDLLIVEDRMKDNKTKSENLVHPAFGTISFHLTQPQIVTFGNDNAIGFRLLTLEAFDWGLRLAHGQLAGITKFQQCFVRLARLKRAPTGREYEAMVRDTGIRLLKDWENTEHHAEFLALAKHGLEQKLHRDPVLILRDQLADVD